MVVAGVVDYATGHRSWVYQGNQADEREGEAAHRWGIDVVAVVHFGPTVLYSSRGMHPIHARSGAEQVLGLKLGIHGVVQ